jgi:hypothetical protein
MAFACGYMADMRCRRLPHFSHVFTAVYSWEAGIQTWATTVDDHRGGKSEHGSDSFRMSPIYPGSAGGYKVYSTPQQKPSLHAQVYCTSLILPFELCTKDQVATCLKRLF